MESYLIEGGHKLSGEVSITGAKNAVLGIMAAAVLSSDVCTIDNVPHIQDVNKFIEILKKVGAKVEFDNNVLKIDPREINKYDCSDIVGDFDKMRASYYLLGAFLGRFGKAVIPKPGGCIIGLRPIDQHVKGFRALGATVDDKGPLVGLEADELNGSKIRFDVTSVGATINVMLAAVLAKGKTVLTNAAQEPHVVDIANFLNLMGAKIRGAGTNTITITGVDELKGVEYSVIPDQITTGTYMIAAAATEGDIVIKNTIPAHMETLISVLNEMGIQVEIDEDNIHVWAKKPFKPVDVKTDPYPGFPTDLQQPLAVLMMLADGESKLVETIFENRFEYIEELKKMGADVEVYGGTNCVIDGCGELHGDKAILHVPDLRAGAALVIAAMASNGVSQVKNVHYIDRGYEDFEDNLNKLGAKIRRIEDEMV